MRDWWRAGIGATGGNPEASLIPIDEERAVEKAKRHFRVSTRPVGAQAYFVTHEYGHDTTWALIAHLTRRDKPVPLSMPYEWLVEEIA